MVKPKVKISLDPKKLDAAYKWFKANERGMGGWAGLRNRVYNYEVKGLSVAEVSKIPYWQREQAPRTWNLPPEYMVAYFRTTGMTKAQAIKKVETQYLPALQREAVEATKLPVVARNKYKAGKGRKKIRRGKAKSRETIATGLKGVREKEVRGNGHEA